MNNSVELPSNVWPVCKQTWVSRVSESFNHPPQVAYLRSSAASPELWHNDWIFKNVGIRIVFVLALVGCTRTQRSTEANVVTLACNVRSNDPPSDLTVYFDELGLESAPKTGAALQASSDGASENGYYAKSGLWFRGTTPVTIEILNAAPLDTLGWGERSPKVVTPKGCGTDSRTWNELVGGYRVDHPKCITLRITSARSSHDVQIGVGAACRGQKPPPD